MRGWCAMASSYFSFILHSFRGRVEKTHSLCVGVGDHLFPPSILLNGGRHPSLMLHYLSVPFISILELFTMCYGWSLRPSTVVVEGERMGQTITSQSEMLCWDNIVFHIHTKGRRKRSGTKLTVREVCGCMLLNMHRGCAHRQDM